MLIGSEFASLYVVRKIDIDGSYYDLTREDVLMAPRGDTIDNLIKYVRDQVNKASLGYWYYIKGNYLYYTYKGHKFWTIISCTSDEYMYVRSLINKMRLNGCTSIYYDGGRAD